MKDVAGRVAVITGAASGIGLALAHRLAREQVKLVLLDVEEPALAEAEAALRAAGAEVLARRCDVGRAGELDAAAEAARARFGVAHIICNNAGVSGAGGPSWTLSEADWEWTLSVNLWGVIRACARSYPRYWRTTSRTTWSTPRR